MYRILLMTMGVLVTSTAQCQLGWYGSTLEESRLALDQYQFSDQFDYSREAAWGLTAPYTVSSEPTRHGDDPLDPLFGDLLEESLEVILRNILFTTDQPEALGLDSLILQESLHDEAWSYVLLHSTRAERSGLEASTFGTAYAHWQMNQKDLAVDKLLELKAGETYFAEGQYLLGIYYARQADWKQALNYFEKLKGHRQFDDVVPLLLAQLYNQQNQDSKVIELELSPQARPSLQVLMARVQGISLLRLGENQEGLHKLEWYADRSNKVEAKDRLVMGATYYQNQEWESAQKHLEMIAHLDDSIGQVANYYLGDIYLLDDRKIEAKNAFQQCARINAIEDLTEQSFYYAGKIAAELGYDREALEILTTIPEQSPYFSAAQSITADILLSTEDYTSALQVLKGIPSKNDELKSAEVQLKYLKAIELFQSQKWELAGHAMEELTEQSHHLPTQALGWYWAGELSYRAKRFEQAVIRYRKVIEHDHSSKELVNQAYYSLGYSLLNSDPENAMSAFSQVKNLKEQASLYEDAQIKVADLLLNLRDYSNALVAYRKCSQSKSRFTDYALYQQAIIHGLQGAPVKKIVLLEELTEKYPDSHWKDDAYVEWGKTALSINEAKEALKVYNRFLDEFPSYHPDRSHVLNQAGLVALNLGAPSEAIQYYKQVFNHNPSGEERKTALRALEEIYIKELGRPDAYLTFVEEKGLSDLPNPRKDSLSYFSAEFQFQQGKLDQAKSALQHYITAYPNGDHLIQAYYLQGEIYLSESEFSEALLSYSAACQDSRGIFDACYKAGRIAEVEKQDIQQSLTYYDRAIKVSQTPEENHQAGLSWMKAKVKLEQYQNLDSLANQILKYEKAGDEDLIFAHYALAKSLMAQGDSLTAVNHLNVLAKGSGEKAAESRYLIARIYYENDQLALAEKLCDQANKSNSGYTYWLGEGLILYSQILIDLNQPLNARAALQAILSNYPSSSELYRRASSQLTVLDEKLNAKNKLNDEK